MHPRRAPILLLALGGCGDWSLTPEPKDTAGPPMIVVAPGQIDEHGICRPGTYELVISNAGASPLALTGLALDGDAWSARAPVLPVSLDPDEDYTLVLDHGEGEGVLHIESDDPARPLVDVPLSAYNNHNPDGTLLSPYEEQVVGEGEGLELRAAVADDEDDPTALEVSFISSALGIVGVVTPDAEGIARLSWADPPPGPQTLRLDVRDSCRDAGGDSLFFCVEGPETFDALAASKWLAAGAAMMADGVVTVVDGDGQVGAAWDVSTVLRPGHFHLELGVEAASLRGFTLGLLDGDRREAWLGGEGDALGLAADADTAALPGLAFAFVLRPGDDAVSAEPYVAAVLDGALDTPLAWAPLPFTDGAHTLTLDVDDPRWTLSLDGAEVLELNTSIPDFPGFPGLTAATEGPGSLRVTAATWTRYECPG